MRPIRILVPFAIALLCVGSTFAAGLPQAALTGDFDQLLTEGWEEIAPGVYQRITGHDQELLAYGDAGPRLELGWLDSQITLLTESFEQSGSAEVAQTLQDLELRRNELIEAAQRETTTQQIAGMDFLTLDAATVTQGSCTAQIDTLSTAGAGTSGPRATASTGFSDNCGRSASVYCYAYARGYSGTVYSDGIQSDGPRTVYGSGSCNTSEEVEGDNNCFANSRSQIQFLDSAGNPATYSHLASTTECVPFTVIIGNGPTSIEVPPGQCVQQRATAGSNRQGTAFNWRHNNGTPVAGTFFDLEYCNMSSSSYTSNDTLVLTGTADGQTANDTAYYPVVYTSDPGGPGEPCDPSEGFCPEGPIEN